MIGVYTDMGRADRTVDGSVSHLICPGIKARHDHLHKKTSATKRAMK